MTAQRPVARRALLVTAAAGCAALLGGCSGTPQTGESTRSAPSAPPAAGTGYSLPAEPRFQVDPATAGAVDPHVVAERYAHARPTGWDMALTGIRTIEDSQATPTGAPRMALTFDACGGSGGDGVDRALLAGLRSLDVPATVFLNSRWIDANPAAAAELAADDRFLIGNHGTRHVPLSVTGRSAYGIAGTASAAEAVDEVWSNHLKLTELTGRPPRHFRAGTAHYDDVAVQIVRELGETPVGFSVNGDGGATFSARTIRREIGKTAPGGIVICHLNQPTGSTAAGTLAAIADLKSRGFVFAHVDG